MAEERVDVLICGSGSAGLCAALWLARCGVNYKIVERRPGPLKNGQADGVQCRTVEIFESFGISESLLKEAYHVLEVAFWASDGKGSIQRTHYAPDLEPGLSHQPHVILNQARLNGLMIEEIQRCSGRIEMDYGVEVKHVEVDDTAAEDYEASCVTTKAVTADGTEKVFKSKYVLVRLLQRISHFSLPV
jgi:phenol 2-monooxygenase